MKKISNKKQEFNNFRFNGFEVKQQSNKYLTMNRISNDNSKVIIDVNPVHLFKTKFGYGLILNSNHVLFVKDWQVNFNNYKTEVLIDSEYFVAKEFGNFEDFADNNDLMSFEGFLKVAELQKENKVMWEA